MSTWHELDEFWETVPMFPRELLDAAPQQVEALLALTATQPGAAVLDMPCGVGRHSLELARRGFAVTGVDRTDTYLRSATEKAAAQGLEVELIQADMRQFVRVEAYDLALNLFTSFGYFEDPADDRRVAENLFRSLKPGGVLVMEMMGKEVLARIFLPRDWQELPDGTFYLQERTVTRDWSWIENRWILIRPDGRRHEYAVNHRLYDGAGLKALLQSVGFSEVELYGSLAGEPYDTQARRLVAVACRAQT
jgi:SAM-dependent methyltransferase